MIIDSPFAKSKKADQGKYAEGEVRKFLTNMDSTHQAFDWHRGYDARSAGGKFQRIAGDFSFYTPKAHGIIEVKEIASGMRLPYDNFELSQVAKANKRELAGGVVIVLVCRSTGDKTWWKLPVTYFKRDGIHQHGSWLLPTGPTYSSCAAALDGTFRSIV